MNGLTAAIAAAFVGAFTAQIIAHYLTSSREKRKEAMNTYQKLIAPILPDVLFFLDTETNFRKGHDVERKIDLEHIVDFISKNINFGNSKLLYSLFTYQRSYTFFDGRGYEEKYKLLSLFFWFLHFTEQIMKNIEEMDSEMNEELKVAKKYYGLWAILTDLIGYERATDIMMYKWMLSDELIGDLTSEYISALLKQKSNQTIAKQNLIKNLIVDLESNGCNESVVELLK